MVLLVPRQRLLRLLLPLAFACVLASGCTARQSRTEYEDRLKQALEVRQQVVGKLDGHQLTTQAQYDDAAKLVNASLDELDSDPPPRDARDGHDSMVAGMEGLASLLGRLGRCEGLGAVSDQDQRACRQGISQDVYDEIRNDFSEANTIYRSEGFSLPGLGSADEGDGGGGGDNLSGGTNGGDKL